MEPQSDLIPRPSKAGVAAIGTAIAASLVLGSIAFGFDSPSASAVGACTLVSPSNLAAYWRLDEGSGSTIADASGNSHTGALLNSPTWTTGTPSIVPNPAALSFDGTDDYALVSDVTGLPSGSDARSISLWMNQPAVTEQATLLSLGNGNDGNQKFILQMGSAGADTYLFTDGINPENNIALSGSQIPTAGWHHVAFTFDGASDWKYYLDGVLTGSGTFPFAINTVTNALEIGSRHDAGTGFYNGSLDDIRVYGRALSETEVGDLAGGCSDASSSSSSVSSGSGSSVSSGSGSSVSSGSGSSVSSGSGSSVSSGSGSTSSSSSSSSSSSFSGTLLIVQPQNMRGWAFNKSGTGATGTGSFVHGPKVPPYGTGSVKFTTGSDGDYLELRNGDYAGKMLSDLSELKYSTFVPTASGSSNNNTCQAPYLILNIDNNGDMDPDDEGDQLLFFEPCYQSGSVLRDTWQEWNAFEGQWYPGLDRNGPPTFTLDEYLSTHSGAKIVNSSSGKGGVRIDAGGGGEVTSDDIYYADAFTIDFDSTGRTGYDFEPADRDSDGLNDNVDNCPLTYNPTQADTNSNGIGDACETASSSSSSSSASSVQEDTGGAGGGRGGGGGGRRPVTSASSSNNVPGGGFGGEDTPLPFDDVPNGSFYEDAVRWLLGNGFIDSSDFFRPGTNANRAETAKLLIEVMGGPLHTDFSGTSFDDVRAGTWYYVYFEDGGERGWVKGDSNCYGRHPCTGRPSDTILRAEIAALITRAFAMPRTGEAPRASDVPSGQWYTQYMEAAADHCVIRGDAGTGKMRPLQAINRGEIAVMMYRAWLDNEYDNGCSDVPMSSSSSSRSSLSSSRSSLSSSSSSTSSSMSSSMSSRSSSFSSSSLSSASFSSSSMSSMSAFSASSL